MVRHAVERNLHTLGEAVIRLQRVDPELAAELPDTDKIVGLRHRLAHGYLDDIDDDVIREAATVSAPVLLADIEGLLREDV